MTNARWLIHLRFRFSHQGVLSSECDSEVEFRRKSERATVSSLNTSFSRFSESNSPIRTSKLEIQLSVQYPLALPQFGSFVNRDEFPKVRIIRTLQKRACADLSMAIQPF